jgi:thiamine monophosphate kinase
MPARFRVGGGGRAARCAAVGVMLFVAGGCPGDTMAGVELTERITIMEDAFVQMDQENAELATRLLSLEARLARQDTLLRRMSSMMDQMAVAIERR